MRKIKIFHLITRFIKGGADENTLLTVLGLDKKRYEIHLGFGNQYDKEQANSLKKEHIKIKKFSSMQHRNPFSALISLFEVYRYIKKNDFDIVHVHSTEAGIIGRIAAKLAGIPIIVYTLHGLPFSETRSRLINWVILICEKITAKFTTRTVSNADNLVREYLRRGIGKKSQYTTIYSGININHFKNARPIREIKNKSQFNIAFISRITEGKGHKEAVNAMHLLKNENIHLFVVGDGELYSYYKSKGNNKSISFLGYRNDINRIITSCDLLILPSYREGTPRCITEAMAASKPVIATNIAGIPEQIKDNKNGFLIPIKNSEILAEKIKYLLKNPETAKKMGKEGYKRVHKFSSKQMVRRIDMLYTELLKRC